MKHHLIFTTLFSLAGIGTIYAESRYEPPQPVKIMFHLDKLPIDKGMRKQLSSNLTTLAKRGHDGSAKEQRLTAQLLMLAMRLDRENSEATELNNDLSKGGALPKSDQESRDKALARLRRANDQLNRNSKNLEARKLEAYLQDVIVALDGSNPLAVRQEEYIKRWEGIVPTVDKDSVITMPELVSEKPDDRDNKRDVLDLANTDNNSSTDDQSSQEYVRWKMHNSSIILPLTFFTVIDDRIEYSEELVDLNTQIFPRVNLDSNLILELKPWAEEEQIVNFKEKIDPFMKQQFGKYESVKVEISTTGRLSKRSLNQIMFPLALQLKASERNIEIKPGLYVLGNLSGSRVTRNHDFWYQLKYLRKEKGSRQRLFIPMEAAADLKQLVALEEEDFFVRNEVLLVSDIEQAVDMLGESKNPDINQARAEFAKLQEMIGDKSIGPFAVNAKIRSQLEGILAKNPNHLSAKMILLRGNVARPKKLDSYFIADELSAQLNRTSYLNERKENEISEHHTNEIAGDIQRTIQNLQPFLDSKDRKLATYLTDIAEILETISRAKHKQRQDERQDKRPSKALQETIIDGLIEFKIKYKEAKTQLDMAMSELPKV